MKKIIDFFIAVWFSIKETFKGRYDYLLHPLLCYFIATFLTKVFVWFGIPYEIARIIALVITAIIAIWKEFWHDKRQGKGTFELWDLVTDWFGIIAAAIVLFT